MSQKERERERTWENRSWENLKKTSLTWERKQPTKSRKRRESQAGHTQGGAHWDTEIKMTNTKARGKILETRGKWHITIQENFHQPISWFLNGSSTSQKGMSWCIWSDEREESTTKNTLPSKTLTQIRWSYQKLSRQAKVKKIQQNHTNFTTNAKGFSRKET